MGHQTRISSLDEQRSLGLILGNQLFDLKYLKNFPQNIFMCEETSLCTHYLYHKHKIIHFLASMREFRDQFTLNYHVHYFTLKEKTQFEECLKKVIKKLKVKKIITFEIEDKFFERFMKTFCDDHQIQLITYPSPMFLCSRIEFQDYLSQLKKPLMNSFYIQMRKKYQVLMNKNQPIGQSWSFDQLNRKKIPKTHQITLFYPPALKSKNIDDCKKLVNKYFHHHPGNVDNYWIPTTRADALKWFKAYLKERFEFFGDYQDALEPTPPFLYHSVISPLLNMGLLTPHEVIKAVEKRLNESNLNSVEGFIRQVLGWREFVRGIYQNYSEREEQTNFFQHHKKLSSHWYQGETGIPPLDDAIKKAVEWGYCHHIERLMVIGNLMLLLEIEPAQAHRWFMEMFVDSSDWVMGPNVYGMALFSDGGIFATKPYIAGSNYPRKMGHYPKGDWCEAIDGLYWQFIEKHQAFFIKNHRMSMMVKTLQKMDFKRKQQIYKKANQLKDKLTR